METIIAAGIGGVVTLTVCLINNHFTHKKTLAEQKAHNNEIAEKQRLQALEMDAKQQQTVALIEYKLDELTRHVEKHNQVIERTYKLEQLAVLFDEKMKVANKRIADAERYIERHQDEKN